MKYLIFITFIFFFFSVSGQIKTIKKLNDQLKIIKKENTYFLSNSKNKVILPLSFYDSDVLQSVTINKIKNNLNEIKIECTLTNENENHSHRSRLRIRYSYVLNKKTNKLNNKIIEFVDFEKQEIKSQIETNYFYSINYDFLKNKQFEIFDVKEKGIFSELPKSYYATFDFYKNSGVFPYNIKK